MNLGEAISAPRLISEIVHSNFFVVSEHQSV